MLNNNFGEEGANAIVDVVKGNPQINTLCGIKPDLTEANFSIRRLRVGDAVLLAFDLKKNSVLIDLGCAQPKNYRSKSAAADDSNRLSFTASVTIN